MNRHIVTTTIVISLFAFFSCNLICDVDELKDKNLPFWQHPAASGTYEWQEAIDCCDGLDLAGHTDWYLPGRDDFIDLLGDCDSDVTSGDPGYCNSCEESEACSALFGSDDDIHWSSSPYDSSVAWNVNFFNGLVIYTSINDDYDVRCVRPGP